MLDNDSVLKKIADALLVDYSSVYYVNAVTNEYQWYSADPEFHSLHITRFWYMYEGYNRLRKGHL